MKRLIPVAALITLLIAPMALAGGNPQSDDLCRPQEPPDKYLNTYINDIGSNYAGLKLCPKTCKNESNACKAAASSLFKCSTKQAKAYYKTRNAKCQMDGGDKKTCSSAAKDDQSTDIDSYKGEFANQKKECGDRLLKCKSDCNH